MKQHSSLRRGVVMAGVCLLLAGILAASLGWTTASSSRPAAQPVTAQQPRAGGESATASASTASAASPSGSEETPKGSADPAAAVRSAWKRARDAGVYDFATDLGQSTYPARTLYNAGSGPQRVDLHMEGDVDIPARSMEFRLWQPGMSSGPLSGAPGPYGMTARPGLAAERAGGTGGAGGSGGAGSVTMPAGGAEARIEGDRAFLRSAGGEWKEVQDFSTSFAPDSDPLAFLAGVKDVQEIAAEDLGGKGAGGQPQSQTPDRGLEGNSGERSYVSRFAFQLDGPTFATYLRDQLERQLRERGGLPLNVTLDSPSAFREMTGHGELWVDGRGLPLRLNMHLSFPEQRDGSHLEADIQTDFSGFPEQLAAAPTFGEDPLAWAKDLVSQSAPAPDAGTGAINNQQQRAGALSASAIRNVAETGGTGGALACGLGITALLLACRRSRRLYAAVVIAVIFSMVVVPLMQSERAAAFFERQAARSGNLLGLGVNPEGDGTLDVQALDSEVARAQQANRQAIVDFVAPPWNPAQDPMAQPDKFAGSGSIDASANRAVAAPLATPAPPSAPQATPTPSPTPQGLNCDQNDKKDDDNDGVSNFEECVYGTVPSPPAGYDTDRDGLSDGQELNKLGTDPTRADTDGDVITDTLEVTGFSYGNRQWYLNPNNADTNNDGMIDSAECPVLVDTAAPTAADFKARCDSDQDGIPNPFESDNDNDGVPDRVDLSPDTSVDNDGKGYGPATAATAFDRDRPFKLSVTNLQADWPVFVDLQLRPVITDHLAYSLNVLDWPSRDRDGQIQHNGNTTFADSNNPDIANPQDAAGAHGDMRLVPLLEISMTGQHVPLKLTDPAVTVTVRSDTAAVEGAASAAVGTEISATVKLAQGANHADTTFTFEFEDSGSYDIAVYDSACPVSGSPAGTYTGVVSGVVRTYLGKSVVDLADGHHAIVVSGAAGETCADIPNVINGPYSDQMVDMSVLSPYGITMQERDDGSLAAYVPLSVVPDDTGGGKSAFQARMLYWPGANSTWDAAQQLRILWLVQMLTDSCADGAPKWEVFQPQYKSDHPKATDQDVQDAFNTAFAAYCAANRTPDALVPVQTYDESWYLAGLAVREDHGLDVAVAYPNPELPTYDDDALWTLSWGLGKQFIPGRDCETDATIYSDPPSGSCQQDKLRDLTIFPKDSSNRRIGNSTIRERFDITSTVPSAARWGIAQNALLVDSFRQPHQDYVAYLAMTETPLILAQYSHEITPSLLFAREEHYRSAGLEAGTMPAGGELAMDVSPSTYREVTLTGLQWAPFRYNETVGSDGKVIGWEAYPTSDYWTTLEGDLKARFRKLFPNDDPETNMGRTATARAYEFALMNGVANNVHCTPEELLCPIVEEEDGGNEMLISAVEKWLSGLNHVTVEVMHETMESREVFKTSDVLVDLDRNGKMAESDDLLETSEWVWGEVDHPEESFYDSLGDELLHFISSPWKTVFTSGPAVRLTGGIVAGAAAGALIATVVIGILFKAEGAQIGAIVVRSITLLIALQCTINAISTAVEASGGSLKAFGAVARANLGLGKNISAAGVIATVIHLVIVWGAFVVEFLVGHMAPGSIAFNSALAGAIATTIVSVILFIIFTALGPIGALIQAFVGLLDAIVSLICSALPEEMQTGQAGQWLCGGITGLITNFIKWWIYSGTIMVNLDPEDYDRLEMGNFETELADTEAGVVVGNKMIYSIALTNTIDLADRPVSPLTKPYDWQFSVGNLQSSNFAYRWQTEEDDFHSGLSLGGMPGGWAGDRPSVITLTKSSEGIPLTDVGINRPVGALYLSEAYAVPEQQCWSWSCKIEADRSTNHFDMGSGLTFDVLPATLDGFYALTRKGDGYALAWGQKGHLTFPTLYDADGDGLSRTDDPDDSKWDADGDGLSDAYELNTGSGPLAVDTDHDGLTDYQEAQSGTDPTNKDSDGDGLYDCQEVFHQVEVVGDQSVREVCGDVAGAWSGGWTIVYGMEGGTPLRTLVTSNPVDVDADADGLTDHQEYVYGFNPNVSSNANILSLKSELQEPTSQPNVFVPTDGYIQPGQALYYAATVQNQLDDRQAQGLFWTESGLPLDMAKMPPQSFNLRPHAQTSMSGPLWRLSSSPASGVYTVTQVARALISNLAVESGQAELWMRFDDAAAPFADWSGSIPPHDGACYGPSGPDPYSCQLDPLGGRIGDGLSLNTAGTDEAYVQVPIDVSETAYAVSLWFKTTCTNCGIFSVTKGTSDHDRHVYLSNGNVCTRVYSGTDIVCTSGTSYADGQWHHVVHTFGLDDAGQTEGQKIYVDGVLGASGSKTASDFTWQDAIKIGYSQDAAQPYFSGSIDDVRVFDKALTQVQVRGLANLSVFHMNFDQTNAWTDVSMFDTPVTSSHSPSHDTATAVHGAAASFDGTTYLSVPGGSTAPQLDMSGGRFTLSAWIYPREYGNNSPKDTYAQGILGLNSGLSTAYPTLQRVGKKILFSLGTGSAWVTPYTSGDVLTVGQWNHVAVTLDKDESLLRLYVNGELQGDPVAFAVPAFAATKSFDIGRSSRSATLKLTNYYNTSLADGDPCRTGYTSRMCMAIDQVQAFNYDAACTEGPVSINKSKTFNDTTTVTLWADEYLKHFSGVVCGSVPDDSDYTCTMSYGSWSGTNLQITSNDTAFSNRKYTYGGSSCGTGYFYATFTNTSIPFYGSMDEVEIFGQVLDEDTIRQLYLDGATLLRLPLDEAPGATAFEDLSEAHVAATCDASGCPVSGTTGRINGAAQFHFDPTENTFTAISLVHSAANELSKSFTVAAWIKPSGVTRVQTIVSTARPSSDNGWGFRLSGSDLAFEPYGFGTSSTSQLGLPAGRWSHVAAVVDASYGVTFYVNGASVAGAHTGTYGGAGDFDDRLLVGAALPTGHFGLTDLFDGQIDDVWVFSRPLSAARIQELYQSAPAFHMFFDEPAGATEFADSAVYGRYGTCTKNAATDGCPLTGEGVRGQVGLAAQFDGLDDSVTVDSFGSFNETTVSAWVKLIAATNARETIVSYKESGYCGFVLDLNDDGTNQYPRFHVRVQSASGTAAWQAVTSEHTLPLNAWMHLVGTYDGNKIRLYQNGVLQVESSGTTAAGTMVNTCTLNMAIGSRDSLDQHWFPGAIDEVQVYGRALTEGQIHDLFNYQSAWTEARQSTNVTVDTDSPRADLLIGNGTYLANQTIWVGITASDATSGVDKVELRADKGSVQGSWTPAERCAENLKQPEGAWCAQFTPLAGDPEGVYTLRARATDRVGYMSSPHSVTVYVDDTAPVLDDVSYGLMGLEKSGSGSETWVVRLSGGVTDPPLSAGGVAGSGVPADGVRVTIQDADGQPLGNPRQVAAVAGGTWTLDYQIGEAEPDGCFTVEVEAEDAVARIPQLDPEQVGRHTAMLVVPIVLETKPPQVLLDRAQAIAGGQLGAGVTSLGGETTHRPVPVEVDLTAVTGADQTRVRLTCQHGNEGTWYTLFDLPAGTLNAGDTQTWEGDIHHWSSCQAELTTAAPAGGVSGVVKVCGTQIASWTGDFSSSHTEEFVVDSDSCGDPGCPAGSPPPVSSVQGVDLAFKSVLPGSAFLNEAAPAGEILHLPFEDIPTSSGGMVARDVSGVGSNGSCSAGACPVMGQPSPSGTAGLFDGVNDSVRVPQVAGQGTTDSLTVAAWIYPTERSDGAWNPGTLISRYGQWEIACTSAGLIRWAFHNTNPGWAWHSTGYTAPLDRWTHVVVVYDNGVIRTYVNGNSQPVDTYNGAGSISNAAFLDIGGWPNTTEWFSGSLDEVRLFTRALTAAEIKALYTGSSPLLTLSFEKSWATGGDSVTDASGWGRDGTLNTGTGDVANKAASGQVGNYALQLDGVDDYAVIPDDDAIDFDTNHDFAVTAWLKPDPAQVWTATTDNNVIEKWSSNGGYPYVIRYLNQTAGEAAGKIYAARWDGQHGPTLRSTTRIDDGRFHHVAFVKSGSMVALYVDGALQGQTTDTTTGATANSSPLYISWRAGTNRYQGYYTGSVDDLRIYPRPLTAPEIADLYHAGWQAATLEQTPSPGVTVDRTSWNAAVPAGLEGTYQVEMRGRDAAAHEGAVSDPSLLWRGEADNLAPRVTLTLNAATNQYTTVAQDYNLVETGFSTPCGASAVITRETFLSPWYLGTTGDRQKLYRLTAVCPVPSGTVTEQSTACDSFDNCVTCDTAGNCTTAAAPETAAQPAAIELAAAIQAESPAQAAIAEVAVAPARPGNPGFVITAPAVITTSHYYEPHTVDLVGAAMAKRSPDTDGHALAGVQVAVGDAAGPAVLSQPASQRPYTVTWTFPWRLAGRDALPDGVSYTAAITATDLAGRTTAVDRTLIADVVPPTAVSLALTSNGTPVEPGAVIRDTTPDLALTWTPSSDGSALGPYLAAWRIVDAYTTTIQTSLHDPSGPLEAHLTAGEAQRITTGVVSRDAYGNERRQEFGSVVVDGPLTPDYITPLTSGGSAGEAWMESGCTLGGADRRIADLVNSSRILPLSLQRRLAQHGYVTWDRQALRLAWAGAKWSVDGDLFIYLDTGPGGTNSTFTPYPVAAGGTTVVLPPDLQADVLIWVQDANTASLLRWNGSNWAYSTSLSPDQYRFDGSLNGGQTDFYLPFERLGMKAGDPLGALAFAADEPAPETGLRIWATLPVANPVNSGRVNRSLALAPAGSTLTLLHAARWDALSDGVCPNGTNGALQAGQHSDAVPRMTVSSDPPGAAASGVADGLFWVSDPDSALADPEVQSLFGFLHPAQPPLPDGQEIAYTVHYRNEGSTALQGAWLALSAFGALQLGSDVIDLGDIPPGGEGSVTFRGTADRSRSEIGLAVMLARLYAASSGPDVPLEWLIAAHRVDRGAPDLVGLRASASRVGAGGGWLDGTSSDESGVSRVEIEIRGPTGATSTLTCDLQAPASGQWSCPWDAVAANGGVRPQDGEEYTVRLRATDKHGYTGDWSASYTIRVDALPPTITHSLMGSADSPARLVRGSALRLTGEARDEGGVRSVTICIDGGACRKAGLGAAGSGAVWWSRWLNPTTAGTAGAALDYVTKTLSISAADRLGNGTDEPLLVPVVFDNVAPVLVTNQIQTLTPLRSAGVAPGSSQETVLSGAVSDGGPGVRVTVRVQGPGGDITRYGAARDGDTWWFDLPSKAPGQYTLWVDAEDLAGNVTTAGPFTVDVTCTNAMVTATGLAAEPVEGQPMSLTLTTVISNAGPDPLPAGIPITLTQGATTTIGWVTTTVPLAAGESEALSLIWRPDGTGNHDIAVHVGQAESRAVRGDGIPGPGTQTGVRDLPYLPNGPLCVTPPALHFTLPVRDLTLGDNWTLISPQINPTDTDVQIVQRGINRPYAAILGYDGGLRAYYPDRPQDGTLQTVDALHGYWVRAVGAYQPPTDTPGDSVPTWRMAGEVLPEDQPLPLSAGWNLVGYLPYQPLTVTTALQGIAGMYASVLGFERTSLSYYPDLDPSYDTLSWMAPGSGYWISATQAITLHYPLTAITETLPMTTVVRSSIRLDAVREAESAAGVRPTYEWMNFYGKLALPDGTGVPTGTVVLAVDPQGTICGATATWEPGQYGLLACYADDPDTAEDEGASPGDTIRLVVGEGSPPQPGSWVIGEGTWTAHGARQQVPAGAPPELPNRSYLPLVLRGETPTNEALAPGPEEPGPAPDSESVPANQEDDSGAAE